MDGTSNNSHGCANGTCRRDNVGRIDGSALTGVDRRGFIVQEALRAAAAALAACGVSSDLSAASLAIVRTGTSSFVALSRICPHQGGTVQQSGNGFQCPVHGATFSQTGQWVGGQRTSSLHACATAYDATAGTFTIT